MQFWHIMLLVGFMLMMDMIVVGAILNVAVQTLFEPLSKRFPPQEMMADVVEKPFQTVKVGIMNFGMSVHFGVDDKHVHVVPAKLLRWCGGKPSSVPLSEVSVDASAGVDRCRAGKLVDGVIAGIALQAPAWVFREVMARKTARTDLGERASEA